MGLLEIFVDEIADGIARLILNIKGWLAYRRAYSRAERREHDRHSSRT